jgi:hypothetical protein
LSKFILRKEKKMERIKFEGRENKREGANKEIKRNEEKRKYDAFALPDSYASCASCACSVM